MARQVDHIQNAILLSQEEEAAQQEEIERDIELANIALHESIQAQMTSQNASRVASRRTSGAGTVHDDGVKPDEDEEDGEWDKELKAPAMVMA